MAATTDKLLTTREVADRLRLSRDSIYRMVEAGRLTGTRLTPNGPLRFAERDVAELLTRGRTR